MDPHAEIKKIYFEATKVTIQKDLERALDLLKTIPVEEDRDKAAVYIHGLMDMRAEWRAMNRPPVKPSGAPRPPASGRRPSMPQARSDRSKASSRRIR